MITNAHVIARARAVLVDVSSRRMGGTGPTRRGSSRSTCRTTWRSCGSCPSRGTRTPPAPIRTCDLGRVRRPHGGGDGHRPREPVRHRLHGDARASSAASTAPCARRPEEDPNGRPADGPETDGSSGTISGEGLRRLHPDRRRHQPGQQRRTAARRDGPLDRGEHRDLEPSADGGGGDRVCRPRRPRAVPRRRAPSSAVSSGATGSAWSSRRARTAWPRPVRVPEGSGPRALACKPGDRVHPSTEPRRPPSST